MDNIKKHFIHYLKYKLTKCCYYKTIAGLHDIKSKLYIIYKTQIWNVSKDCKTKLQDKNIARENGVTFHYKPYFEHKWNENS